jgi:predicted dehydrogenase
METTKVAIIGCGTIANGAHIPNYMAAAEAEIKYFCDIIPEKAKAAVDKYGCGIAVADYHDILNDPEITAVSVCTPNKMHTPISIDFLMAGKNVLCEKPAARTYKEALLMQEAQHRSGKVLNIGVVNRFNTAVNQIKNLIDAGELGEVYHVYVSFRSQRGIPGLGGAFTTKEISGGGVLIDIGVHNLDIVMYCTGDPQPKTVSGKAFCRLGADMKNYIYKSMWAENTKNLSGTYDVDDFITGFIRTEGPTISLNGAWAQNIGVKESYIDFMGTKAGIRLQYGGRFEVYGTKNGELIQYQPEYDMCDMFSNEITSFLRCIKTGEKLPSHIDTVILTARLMQGLYDSSETGNEIMF